MTKLVLDSLDDEEKKLYMMDMITETHAWIKDVKGRM